MRKLYSEFFYIPKHGKIREKVMLTRVVMTITVMVMCLVAMSITAYAYFSYNVTSGSNIIKAANFEANVSITITDSRSNPITVTKDGKIQTANLDAGLYTVLLTKDKGTSTATTGFCIITIGDTDYFTQQIGNDVERGLTDGSASVEFTLKVSSATKLEILSHWGTSKYYGYNDEGRPEIFIYSGYFLDLTNGEGDNSDGQDGSGTTTDTTTPPTTDTTTGSEPSNTTPSTTEPTGTSEPTESTTEPTTSTSTEPTVTEPTATEPTATEPTATEPTATEPAATEPAATESTDTTESTETQPKTENTEATDTPTTD